MPWQKLAPSELARGRLGCHPEDRGRTGNARHLIQAINARAIKAHAAKRRSEKDEEVDARIAAVLAGCVQTKLNNAERLMNHPSFRQHQAAPILYKQLSGPELSRGATRGTAMSTLDVAKNFAREVKVWVKNGAPVVPQAEFEKRAHQCAACEFFDADAFMAGKCNKCGCSSFKLFLALKVPNRQMDAL